MRQSVCHLWVRPRVTYRDDTNLETGGIFPTFVTRFFFTQNNSDFYLCVSLFIFWKIWDTLKKYEVTNKNVRVTLKKKTSSQIKKVGVTLKIKCVRKKTEGAVTPLFPHVVVFFFLEYNLDVWHFLPLPSLTDLHLHWLTHHRCPLNIT